MLLVTASIVALFSFAIVAIDLPMLTTAKTQLQNGADAAALAGALQWGTTRDMDETKQAAVDFASFNGAIQDDLKPINISFGDVEVLPGAGPEGEDRIRVTTHRTEGHGDPLRTYFLRIVDMAHPNTADVQAVATAETYGICDVMCVKPWAIPDRWDDADGDGYYDNGDAYVDSNENGFFDAGEPYTDNDGNGLYTPPEFYDPLLTGYQAPGDLGVSLTIKEHESPGGVAPGQYYPVNLPPLHREQAPVTGASWYETWIATCAPFLIGPGDSLQTEPGKMVGPTTHGWQDLIAQDPDAYWDESTNTVKGSAFGQSPRVVLIPFFHPASHEGSGRNFVIVSKVAAMFLETLGPGSQVTGRFMKVATDGTPCGGPSPESFLVGVHLVE